MASHSPVYIEVNDSSENEFPNTISATFPSSSSSQDSIELHVSPSAMTSENASTSGAATHIVDELRPEEIRWMYRDTAQHRKHWVPFIGYDSLRIECKYREMCASRGEQTDAASDVCADELVIVKGGLYEVDVGLMTCLPIYWSSKGDSYEIIRGRWFVDGTWQPVDDKYADIIERQHRVLFGNNNCSPNEQTSGTPVGHVDIDDCCVEWLSVDYVYFGRRKSSSKFYRALSRTFRFARNSGGVRVRRGYRHETVMTDKPSDITHIVFVVHGIGQRMYAGSILKCCSDLREACRKMMKHFPDVELNNKRVEFLPVEWRSSLTLDGDTVDLVTPNKVRDVRTFLNGSAMDVLYYTSPLYRTEIVNCLRNELKRLYSMFVERNPYFEACGGKVSLVAHSLGAVIVYDIVTGWNPVCTSCENSFNSDPQVATTECSSEEGSEADEISQLRQQLEAARLCVRQLELKLMNLERTNRPPAEQEKLGFKLDCFFTLGSPLAVFLALRGVRPNAQKPSQDHILPTSLCRRLLNVFHPSDAIAYRLEPLIAKHYTNVKPLRIHRHDASKKECYEEMTELLYEEDVSSAVGQQSQQDKDACDSCERTSDCQMESSTEYVKMERCMLDDADLVTTETSSDCSDQPPNATDSSDIPATDVSNDTVLDCRLDFMLKGRAMESAYLATLTSHTAYWTNLDVAHFVLTNIFASSYQPDNPPTSP